MAGISSSVVYRSSYWWEFFSSCCLPARLHASWQMKRVVKPHRPQMRKCRTKTTCGAPCYVQGTTIILGNAWLSLCAITAKQTYRKPATSQFSSTRLSGSRSIGSSIGSRNLANGIKWHQQPAVLEMKRIKFNRLLWKIRLSDLRNSFEV